MLQFAGFVSANFFFKLAEGPVIRVQQLTIARCRSKARYWLL